MENARGIFRRLGVCVWTLVAAASAAASDGRIPLYKSCTISSPGSYYVTADINGSGQHIFTIAADDVTVDLNGHVLSNANIAFVSSGHGNLRVTNGRIDGCAVGVWFTGGAGPYRVDGLSITGATNRGIYLAGSSGSFFSCVVENNAVSLSGSGATYAIYVSYCSNARIAGNTLALNSSNQVNANGICFQNCSGGMIRDNVITGSPGHGLSVDASSGNTVSGNTIRGVTGAQASGIYLANGSTANVIERNIVSGGSYQGILVSTGCNNCVLDGNAALQNLGWGILIGATNCVYAYNRTRGNGYSLSPGTGNIDGGGNF